MSESAINYLLTRKSVKFVQNPGPSDDELAKIMQTAMCAPDHGRLRPWRFKIIRGDAINKLLEISLSALSEAGTPYSPEKEAATRRWLGNVPVLIAVACYIDHSNTKIPEHERMLATGAAVSNILNSAHMLGYSAYWSTGLGTYLEDVSDSLGFDTLEHQFMGFVSIGTPIKDLPAPQRPKYTDYVTEWTGV